MSIHDGLVLLTIYGGMILAGAVIDFILFEIKMQKKRRS